MTSAVSFQKISRHFGSVRAVDAVDLEIGGWSTSFSSPVRVVGTRRAARSGPVTLSGLPQGTVDMGAAAILDLGHVTVLVTEHPGVGGIHPGVYRALGVEPALRLGGGVECDVEFRRGGHLGVDRIDPPGA